MGSRPIPPPSTLALTQHETVQSEGGRSAPAVRSLEAGHSQQRAPAPVRPDVPPAPQSRPLRIPAESASRVNGPADANAQRTPLTVAPLSDAVVANRPRASREERPVIQVTIDRLEVRAPTAPKAAAERRKPRPLPSQSLADYLRGGAGGGQR